MSCSCKHLARGLKSTSVPLVLPRKQHRMRSCSKTTGTKGDLVAIHFGGPTWEALDGSSVVGDAAKAQHFKAPDPDGVDWLLLPAKSNAGNGLFSQVTYIQRLFTDGGQAPAGGCDQAHEQSEVLVEYSAQYFFYGPATKQQ